MGYRLPTVPLLCSVCPDSGCVIEDSDRDMEREIFFTVLSPDLPCHPLVGPCSHHRDSWSILFMSFVWDLTMKEDLVLPGREGMKRYVVLSNLVRGCLLPSDWQAQTGKHKQSPGKGPSVQD